MPKMKSTFYAFAAGITILALTPQIAIAQSNPDEINALYACKAEADPDKRLACYDNAVGRLETAQKTGEIVTVSKTEMESVQKDAFGFNIPSLPKLGKLFGDSDGKDKDGNKVREVNSLIDPIKTVSISGNSRMRFVLENGQVWLQTSDSMLSAKRIMRKDPRVAHIKKAALGSYKLQVNGKGPSVKVRRVQ